MIPEARRRGVALSVVRDVVDRLEAAGATRITLEVAPENRAARALYRGLGFVDGRWLRVLVTRRSNLSSPPGATEAERVGLAEAVQAMERLHPETPAYQRQPFYVGSFGSSLAVHGVRGPGGDLVGVVLQRGRAVLDYAAHSADPAVLSALAWAASEIAWEQRLINVVDDDPVGDALLGLGFRVESRAIEMVRQRP